MWPFGLFGRRDQQGRPPVTPTPQAPPTPHMGGHAPQGPVISHRIGNTEALSDGRTLTHIGNVTIGSDGRTFTQVGNTVISSDGRTFTQVGNTVIGSDGRTFTQIGNTTFGSDGSTLTQLGSPAWQPGRRPGQPRPGWQDPGRRRR